MASIEKRTNGDGTITYRVKIRMKGYEPVSESFARRTDATQWAQKTEAAMRERRYFPERVAARTLMSEVIDRYIEAVAPGLEDADHRRSQLRWWREQIGELALGAVTSDVVSRCKRRLMTEPVKASHNSKKLVAPRSGATANRYLAALSAVFTKAWKEWGLVTENPVRKVERARENEGVVRFLDEDERVRFFASLKLEPRQIRLTFHTALATGIRLSEALRVRVRDITLRERLLVINKTKNRKRRAQRLPEDVADELRTLIEERRALGPDARLFPSYSVVRKAFDRLMRRAEIENFRFHDLRHTYASYLAMSGATLRELQDALGHKTLAMVKRYAHLSDPHMAKVVDRMARKFLTNTDARPRFKGFKRRPRPTPPS